ncbi:MAG TPA: tetratricopeptide repeat protein [Alphaproteobacteria bacterium]|nr:tetratricopeptide repeat protein [Alphaproteobacteria bacterium]
MIRRLLLLMALLTGLPAVAGQDDPRLGALFQRLHEARDPAEAATAESLIWSIWLSYTGDVDDVRLLMRRGVEAMNANSLIQAENLFTEVTELAPDFAEGWNRRATVRYMRGDYAGSIADIQATLALEPRHFAALSGLGLCYAELDQLERAIAAFEAALEINPHMSGARANVERLQELLEGEPI